MESQTIEFRAVIKFVTKEGANAKEIHQRMADVDSHSKPKYSADTPTKRSNAQHRVEKKALRRK